MAIRLSTARLAAAVAQEGGIGLIAASGMAFDELRKEIRLARKLTGGKGIIGINAMVAAREFLGLITTAAEEKIDLIAIPPCMIGTSAVKSPILSTGSFNKYPPFQDYCNCQGKLLRAFP